jgi:hypothetical protein
MRENTETSCPQARQRNYRGAGFYTIQILFTTFLQVRQFTGGGVQGDIWGWKGEGGTGEWRKMHREQLSDLQFPPSFICVIKQKQ